MIVSQLRYHPSLIFVLAIACALLGSFALPATTNAQQQTPPGELVRAAIQNELKDASHFHLFTWKERKNRVHGTQVEQLVDTPNGVVSRVILIDDKPLNPAQQKEEQERIRKMLDPEQMRRKLKDQREDDERTRKMLEIIPDAFDFMTIGTVTSPNGHKLTTIRFTAHPGFDPPNRESMVFTGMTGEMLVDETANRLAKIDGVLFKDVNFGWGILGKLYKGGRFYVEQSEVTPSHWDTTKMVLHFDGKALFVKSIHIDDNESSWDFQPVPAMSVEQALTFLNRGQATQNAMLGGD
jgi:hypothetical protein